MKRCGMISCGLKRAAWAGDLGTCVYMRWNQWRLKLRSRHWWLLLILFWVTTPHCWTKLPERDQSLPSGPTRSSRGDVIEGFWSRNQLFPGWSLPCHWSQHFGNAAVSLVGPFRRRPPRSLQHASAVSAEQCSRARHCSSNVSLTCSANRSQQASSRRRSLIRSFKCAD